MIDHDRLFKELLTTFFVEFIELFFPAVLTMNPAKMQLISGFVDTYLRLDTQEEETFQAQLAQLAPQEEEPVMEIVTSWMEQGQERQAFKLIMCQLPRQIGNKIPAPIEEQIRQLTLPQLEELAEMLLDFKRMEDLQGWLQGQALT
jgi:hypothetical protein